MGEEAEAEAPGEWPEGEWAEGASRRHGGGASGGGRQAQGLIIRRLVVATVRPPRRGITLSPVRVVMSERHTVERSPVCDVHIRGPRLRDAREPAVRCIVYVHISYLSEPNKNYLALSQQKPLSNARTVHTAVFFWGRLAAVILHSIAAIESRSAPGPGACKAVRVVYVSPNSIREVPSPPIPHLPNHARDCRQAVRCGRACQSHGHFRVFCGFFIVPEGQTNCGPRHACVCAPVRQAQGTKLCPKCEEATGQKRMS